MLENVYEGLNAGPKVYLSKKYFCEMYPTCVSSKLCEFISQDLHSRNKDSERDSIDWKVDSKHCRQFEAARHIWLIG